MKREYLFVLLCLGIIGCTTTQSQPRLESADVSSISTEVLNPKPIEITLESLPEPYASQSVSQRPQILPIPSQRRFNVPVGFQVNVYAEGLNNPRWLA